MWEMKVSEPTKTEWAPPILFALKKMAETAFVWTVRS